MSYVPMCPCANVPMCQLPMCQCANVPLCQSPMCQFANVPVPMCELPMCQCANVPMCQSPMCQCARVPCSYCANLTPSCLFIYFLIAFYPYHRYQSILTAYKHRHCHRFRVMQCLYVSVSVLVNCVQLCNLCRGRSQRRRISCQSWCQRFWSKSGGKAKGEGQLLLEGKVPCCARQQQQQLLKSPSCSSTATAAATGVQFTSIADINYKPTNPTKQT